jgi:acetylornithine deacetylase
MDMKAGLAAAVFAFKAVADLRLLERGTLSVASVPEEESGGNGTLASVARGHTGDAVIFAEPTDLQVVHRHVGFHSFAVEATGRAGGILRRSWGVSAIEAMGDAIVALRELAAARTARARAGGGYDADDDPGFINIGLVSGGEWPATRAASARASGLLGILPGETLDAAEDEFRGALAAAERAGGAELSVSFGDGGHGGDELAGDHPLVRSVLQAAADVGARVRPTTAGTMVCDAKIVSGGGWAPSVAFGPVGAGLHAADEWVDLPSVLRCAEVLAATAVRYCGA